MRRLRRLRIETTTTPEETAERTGRLTQGFCPGIGVFFVEELDRYILHGVIDRLQKATY
jgi:hypothetical protein